MATRTDVRRIALSLPGTQGDENGASVEVKGKQKAFCWVWKERKAPKEPRVPNPSVLAIRVDGEDAKQMLLSADEKKFFTEPHYSGFPAILVRLAEVTVPELRELLTEGWRCLAPKALVAELDAKKPRRRGGGRGAR